MVLKKAATAQVPSLLNIRNTYLTIINLTRKDFIYDKIKHQFFIENL